MYPFQSEKNSSQEIKVSAILNEVKIMTESKAKKFEAKIAFECLSEAVIVGNEIELGQVLINLISNAIDAVKDCPYKLIEVKSFDEGSQTIVQVLDSGPGVPPEFSEKIFEPFFTTKPVGEGTGLGLSIAKGILEEHRAQFLLTRRNDKTCFEIRFPKNPRTSEYVA